MKWTILIRDKYLGDRKWNELGSYPTRNEAQIRVNKMIADDVDFAVQNGTEAYMFEYLIVER